jgi:hypothetical protein
MANDTKNHERRKTNPDSKDLIDPKQVWKDGEMTPSPGSAEMQRSGMLGRVADAGDVGRGATSPYGAESQADNVGGQTKRKSTGKKSRTVTANKRKGV